MALVLIVDDSRTVRASVEYTLKRQNIEVASAEDGQDGLDVLKKLEEKGKKPDMIISDINMPNMNGIEFIKNVKAKSNFRFIPILVLTTESQTQMKEKGKKAGAAGWLVKPFKPEQLISVVKKFIR